MTRQCESCVTHRDAFFSERARADAAVRSESRLRDEISAAFRKHGMAAGPTAVDRLVEERDAAQAKLAEVLRTTEALRACFHPGKALPTACRESSFFIASTQSHLDHCIDQLDAAIADASGGVQ